MRHRQRRIHGEFGLAAPATFAIAQGCRAQIPYIQVRSGATTAKTKVAIRVNRVVSRNAVTRQAVAAVAEAAATSATGSRCPGSVAAILPFPDISTQVVDAYVRC